MIGLQLRALIGPYFLSSLFSFSSLLLRTSSGIIPSMQPNVTPITLPCEKRIVKVEELWHKKTLT